MHMYMGWKQHATEFSAHPNTICYIYQVAKEETLHFGLLENRLKQLDSSYGALPTHDGILFCTFASVN
jgi:uncharacterized ferritin-like protein (DUF455 family)